jgi:hypothetical protein
MEIILILYKITLTSGVDRLKACCILSGDSLYDNEVCLTSIRNLIVFKSAPAGAATLTEIHLNPTGDILVFH